MNTTSQNFKDRTWQLQQHLEEIFTDPNHPEFFFKDSDFARKYKVSRHTIKKIRYLANIPNRKQRITIFLKKIKEGSYTTPDLAASFSIKYKCMFSLVKELKIPHTTAKRGRSKGRK